MGQMDAAAPVWSADDLLPARFRDWFAGRGWSIRPHQLEMIGKARAGRDALLIAPTGGGKTLAGFLPSLIELAARPPAAEPLGVHTLYLSPLKALAVDVHRNLEAPIAEMGLSISVEARTGDTSLAKRARQRLHPPDILMTTPEQLALFCAWPGSREYFKDLSVVILDEIHAVHGSKRGDLLNLALARLQHYAPGLRRVGLSATVNDPEMLRRWLVAQPSSSPPLGGEGEGEGAGAGVGVDGGASSPDAANRQRSHSGASTPIPDPSPIAGEGRMADLVLGAAGAPPVVDMLLTDKPAPWSGWTAKHAIPDVLEAIRGAKTALVFVNTRFQAELSFQMLWEINDDNLPIALHHGSLAVEQRRKVEAAMGRGELRAVVCTSTLDLGIDWGAVDLVIQLAAPKGSARADPAHRDERTTGWTSRRAPFWCPPTASRCWSARRRARLWPPTTWTAIPSGSALATSWPSTSWVWPAPNRSTSCNSTTSYAAPRPTRRSPGKSTSRWSISSLPAAMRCAPTTASAGSSAPKTGSTKCATA